MGSAGNIDCRSMMKNVLSLIMHTENPDCPSVFSVPAVFIDNIFKGAVFRLRAENTDSITGTVNSLIDVTGSFFCADVLNGFQLRIQDKKISLLTTDQEHKLPPAVVVGDAGKSFNSTAELFCGTGKVGRNLYSHTFFSIQSRGTKDGNHPGRLAVKVDIVYDIQAAGPGIVGDIIGMPHMISFGFLLISFFGTLSDITDPHLYDLGSPVAFFVKGIVGISSVTHTTLQQFEFGLGQAGPVSYVIEDTFSGIDGCVHVCG